MALTAKQRKALPDSAFAMPKQRKYPIPTKKQAQKAGISESQRRRTMNNALSRSAQKQTAGNHATIAKKAAKRT